MKVRPRDFPREDSARASSAASILARDALPALLAALRTRGYQLVGPTLRDGAIAIDRIDGESDLPIGWTEEQDGGRYRLRRREDVAVFGYTVGPWSWKTFLVPPETKLVTAKRDAGGAFTVDAGLAEEPKYAFIGVRSCELRAIQVQDRVFLEGPYVDRGYRLRREAAFIVAVNCTQAAPTCFCVSMRTGPHHETGYDLVLTEIMEGQRHEFLVDAGTERGRELIDELALRPAMIADVEGAEAAIDRAVAQNGRKVVTDGMRELLYRSYEDPRWDDVAKRCMSCGNCTMVCPTCFCTTVEDAADLAGKEATRTRKWDSCHTLEFSYIHGGSLRPNARSRYRQWMTHKLATWIDQFGVAGCVGCGRCITWCPAGIDITEELAAIRRSEEARHGGH
ncbi:MAG: 4Fe-4S dicluster domain-containing protein [Acidobacteria bacterium]|nr:4Fe-4S dicluster domain-containing protein [Acidobacteriota bacterium]